MGTATGTTMVEMTTEMATMAETMVTMTMAEDEGGGDDDGGDDDGDVSPAIE